MAEEKIDMRFVAEITNNGIRYWKYAVENGSRTQAQKDLPLGSSWLTENGDYNCEFRDVKSSNFLRYQALWLGQALDGKVSYGRCG